MEYQVEAAHGNRLLLLYQNRCSQLPKDNPLTIVDRELAFFGLFTNFFNTMTDFKPIGLIFEPLCQKQNVHVSILLKKQQFF
jgi:hypothetical protein